jgi:drug/metabolite transporter (DMT)-like permease
MKSHRIAVLQALFVVFLWATSWVFVKIGLKDIPPLTFAGLRYFTAFLILVTVLFFSEAKHEVKQLSKRTWQRLILLGILLYAATQGAVFVALAYLPAVTTNLLMSFSAIGVATLSIFWLAEKPTWMQWGGILLAIAGAMIYFLPVAIPQNQMIGVIAGLIGVTANVISSVLGREINRAEAHHPLVVTVISMGAGSILLLVAGFGIEVSAGDEPARLGHHPLAGAGEHRLRVHAVESHPPHVDRHRIQRHRRHHDDLDPHPRRAVHRRKHHRQRDHRFGCHRHRDADRATSETSITRQTNRQIADVAQRRSP